MSNKEELKRLVDVLGEDECAHLLRSVQHVAGGQRFWEGDVALLYNEYVKAHYATFEENPNTVVSAGPEMEGGVFAPIPIVKPYLGAERVTLPDAEVLPTTVTQAMIGRRSRREYSGGAISLLQLSTLLQHSCGTTGFMRAYDYTRIPLRSFPSSGGLQAPELYLSVQAVDGVPPGLYHYHVIDHALESVRAGNHGATLRTLALGQPYVEASAVVFLICGNYERVRWKYGERAYRYMCMDVGFLGENIYLAAEALGLGACAIAGFIDDVIEDLLGINGQDEMILLLLTLSVLQSKASSAT